MLFESGNGVAVDLQLFDAPRESARPIDAYVVTEVEGSVTRSARRAAGAAYEAVARHVSDLPAAVAGFDFGCSSQVIGESGGLAFAVALAKHLARQDPGPVAATGEVESSHNGGPVSGIRGIAAKLEAAATVLPSGGHVFYPIENDVEVSAETRRKMAEQGLVLHPVSSVAEAIDLLFFPDATESSEDKGAGKPDKDKGLSIFYLLFLLVVLFATAGLAVWQSQTPGTVSPPAETPVSTLPENQTKIPRQDIVSEKEDDNASQIGAGPNGGEMAPVSTLPENQTKIPGQDIVSEKEDDNASQIGDGPNGGEMAPVSTLPENQTKIPGQDIVSEKEDDNTRQIGDGPNGGEMAAVRPETAGDGASGAFETRETTPDVPSPAGIRQDPAPEESRVSIDISGSTSLNARISKALSDKLEKFFSEQSHYLGPVETVEITGKVYITRVEETWIEETHNFRSRLKVEIRDFFYRDDTRTMPNRNIQVDVDGSGMVEDLISSAAQELMTKALVSVSSKTENKTPEQISPRKPMRREKSVPSPKPARQSRSSSGFD